MVGKGSWPRRIVFFESDRELLMNIPFATDIGLRMDLE
ncbi:hypothetical protein FTUN_2104 [Frigoriglobus tundricola]|uniref:Uncharacterized protein n=1 Tax=Frigoriglobus tundricola TaxID=2774151 RepID=A0A6M5YMQ6_9BACT|nr:hypothetical protein FTUN_2104 [Frigoriglobus tundricola]